MHRYNPSQRKLHLKSGNKRTSIKDWGCLFLKGVRGEEKAIGESRFFIDTCRLFLQCPSVKDHEEPPLFYEGGSV